MVQIILEIRGYKVVNPACIWVARYGWMYRTLERIVGGRTAYRMVLWYDLRMLRRCTHIKMVYNDWRKSKGARLERLKARQWGIPEIIS